MTTWSYIGGDDIMIGDAIKLNGILGGLPGGMPRSFYDAKTGLSYKFDDGDLATVIAIDSTYGSLAVQFNSSPTEFDPVRRDIWDLWGRRYVPPRVDPTPISMSDAFVPSVCSCTMMQLMSDGCRCGATKRYAPPGIA